MWCEELRGGRWVIWNLLVRICKGNLSVIARVDDWVSRLERQRGHESRLAGGFDGDRLRGAVGI